jgi:hypothetical protein
MTIPNRRSASVCLAKCNFVIHRPCNNVTSALCMLFILKALLILAKHSYGSVNEHNGWKSLLPYKRFVGFRRGPEGS